MIVAKAIKPALFRAEVFERYFRQVVERTIDLADKEFGKTYATFNHKPKFVKSISAGPAHIIGETSTDDENYYRLTRGVKGGYKIPKAGPGLLVFPSGYARKSVPRALMSKEGGPYGDLVFRYTQITAKGIEPGDWDITVRQYVTPWFKKWGEDAAKMAAKASGHGI